MFSYFQNRSPSPPKSKDDDVKGVRGRTDNVDTDYYSFGESEDDSLQSTSDLDMRFSDDDAIPSPGGLGRPKANPESSRRPELCVVCGVRPRYSNGRKTYPTCGLTCAAKLEAKQGSGSKPKKMCVVCGTRPRYSRGGKSYPTCGLTCAAKLNPPNPSAGMCEYCHRRPKFFDGKKTYPHCGRTCRDKARLAGPAGRNPAAPPLSVGTNSTCLMCWKAPRRGDSHFCGKSCVSAAEYRAPLLLEAPRGHVTYQRVADAFKASWAGGKSASPDVKKVYKIIEKPAFAANYDQYRSKMGSGGSFSKKGNELRQWHGTSRECNLGDPGNVKLCQSRSCMLCSTIQSSFDANMFRNGISTSSLSKKADAFSKNTNKSSSKAMLLTNVVPGTDLKLGREQLPIGGPPRGYDSVQIVGPHDGRSVSYEHLIVFTGDAVRPSYLVVYG